MDTEQEQFNETKARAAFRKRRENSNPNQIARSYDKSLEQYQPSQKSSEQFNESNARKAFRKREAKESWGKSIVRTMAQIPQGLAEGSMLGILSGLSQMIATAEALDPEDIERLRDISAREGIPFNEELYLKAVENASKYSPTVSGIAKIVEEQTGMPLEAKTELQKGIRFASTAAKLIPSKLQNVPQRAITGAGLSGVAHELKEDLPEAIAEPLSFGLLGPAGVSQAGTKWLGKATKPSGMVSRQFEKVNEPKSISGKRFQKINQKLERDFKDISEKIIAESPIGETAANLKNDPTFKQSSRELLDEAQEIADTILEPMSSQLIKNEYTDFATKKVEGFSLSKREKAYLGYMEEASEGVLGENISAGQLVKQYRKNNRSLGEYFEPGSSKATNLAHKDALLDQNRAIASAMEKAYPESELSQVFKDGNARWTKIMDVETVDEFVSDVFSGDRINFNKLHEVLDKENYGRIFKRALGDEGYKEFEQLLKDLLTTETPYKMLKVAKKKGYEELFRTGLAYVIHPKLGGIKFGVDATKTAYKYLINSMLDKPQIAFTFSKGVKNLKKGDFKAAERDFSNLKEEVQVLPKEAEAAPKNAKSEPKETEIDVTPKQSPETPNRSSKPVESVKESPQITTAQAPKQLAGPPEKPQIEYKPPTKQQKKSMINFMEGRQISRAEKESLKDIRVSLLSTRKKGQQFHGTKQPISKLNPEIYDTSSEQNIYGAGFYTTDALDIAEGYSKGRTIPAWQKKFLQDEREPKPTVYSIKEKTPQNIYDAEGPIDDFIILFKEREAKYKAMRDKHNEERKNKGEFVYSDHTTISTIDEALLTKPKSVRKLYDEIRDISTEVPAWQIQETFSDIQSLLESAGYEGISHQGGLLTNNPEHLVKIYWKPENLEINEFVYPKGITKIGKVGNPPALAKTPTKPITKPKPPKKTKLQALEDGLKAAKAKPKAPATHNKIKHSTKDLALIKKEFDKMEELYKKARELDLKLDGYRNKYRNPSLSKKHHYRPDTKTFDNLEKRLDKLHQLRTDQEKKIDKLIGNVSEEYKEKIRDILWRDNMYNKFNKINYQELESELEKLL